MLEIRDVNIFEAASGDTEAICITTNGVCKVNGDAVMGKGIAKTADEIFHLSKTLGYLLRTQGSRVYHMGKYSVKGCEPYNVFTFPTKHHWHDNSDIELIKQSAKELVVLCDIYEITKCYLPPVGCGCGGLLYDLDVRPIISELLDDRFIVITNYGVRK